MSLDLARIGGIVRTIPNARYGMSVDGTGQTLDLKSVTGTEGDTTPTNLVGKWIFLAARTADITILRNVAPGTAGVGLVLKAGDAPQEFFVEQGQTSVLGAKAGAAATLDILYDTQPVAL